MNSTKVREYIVGLLSKSIKIDDVPQEHVSDVEEVLRKMAPGEDAGAGAGIVKMEVIKFDKCGQWSVKKGDGHLDNMSHQERVDHINNIHRSGQVQEARRLYDKYVSGGGSYVKDKGQPVPTPPKKP
jgi:hypothetical protein